MSGSTRKIDRSPRSRFAVLAACLPLAWPLWEMSAQIALADEVPAAPAPAAVAPAVAGPVVGPAPAPAAEAPDETEKKVDAAIQAKNAAIQAKKKAVKVQNAARQAQNVARAQQFAAQWQPALAVELSFVRQMCPNLAPAKRQVVKKAAEGALEKAVEAIADNPNAFNNNAFPAPQITVREALNEALEDALPADEWQAFKTEAVARVARRKELVILLIVEHVDDALYLSADQCAEITKAVTDGWQDGWESWLQLRYMQGVPNVPNDMIVPYLEAEQKQLWQSTGKMQPSFGWIGGRNQAAKDAGWWDEVGGPAKGKKAGGARGNAQPQAPPVAVDEDFDDGPVQIQ